MQGYFVMNSIKRPLFNYCMLPYLVQEYDLILQLHIVTSSLCILWNVNKLEVFLWSYLIMIIIYMCIMKNLQYLIQYWQV